MTDEELKKLFTLKPIPKDNRVKRVRHLRPETVKNYKAMIKRDMNKGLINPNQFNNKSEKK
tara:strand:+ start:1665 stop:1847 length:183 start_codon:yes stop_codon:yes gene_type:complete